MAADLQETSCDHISGSKTVTVFTSERKWLNRLRKYQEQHPDMVKIIHENNDGSILAHVPDTWFQIRPPRKINLTDEQRNKLAERLKTSRKYNNVNNSDF